MTTFYTYKSQVPLGPGDSLAFTSGKGYYAKHDSTPPPKPQPSKPAPTVAYNPQGYVPGGSSPQVGITIEAQALATPGANAVQVPRAVETNLAQDEITYQYTPTVTTASGATVPEPPSTTYPQTGTLTFSELQACWLANGGDDKYRELAANIALCESGGSTSQVNNTVYPDKPRYHKPTDPKDLEYSVGLWQVNIYAHTQYSEASMKTSDGNAKAIIAISGNGARFAQSNTTCYYNVTKASPVPVSDNTPPGLSSSGAPPSVSAAWLTLLNTLGKKVPAGLDSITSNAEGLVKIFQ